VIGWIRILLVCVVMMAGPSWAVPVEEGWKKVKDYEGIQIFTHPVTGNPMDEFMGIGNINAPLDVVKEIWLDFPSYTRWFGSCREFRSIRTISAEHHHYLVYYVVASPSWAVGVSDRDAVMEVSTEDLRAKEGKVIIKLKALKEPLVPLDSKYVRITHLIGKIILTKVNDKTTNIVYTVLYDPGGNLPPKVVQFTSVNRPFDTITGLRMMVKKDIYYQKAGLNKY
jgi:hypothetical protein